VRLAVTFTTPEVGKRCSWRGELDSFDLGADTTTPDAAPAADTNDSSEREPPFWSARGRSVSLGADTHNKVFCAGVVRPELDSSSIAAGRRWRSFSMERHYEVLMPYGS
jgi:hypothetical protein